MADWQRQLDAIIDERQDWIVALRRHLHCYPEPSGEEHNTSLHLYQQLGDLDLAVTMGPDGRGVVVDGPPSELQRRIALRADIDALRIQDAKNVPYRSRHAGVMHACGHDAHTAVLAGAIAALTEMGRGALPWPVCWRGIFQPSEETATGALEMIRAGALDGAQAILAAHVDPSRAAGKIAMRPGAMTANCDSMSITVHGRGGHAARPHESNDPIAAAAQLISTIYQFVPRATDSFDAVVVTFGEVRGGDNPNVIPECVALHGTLRTLSRPVRERTMHHLHQLVRGIEEISGTRIELEFPHSIRSVDNDLQLVELIARTFDSISGPANREEIDRPSMGSEDFSCYLDQVPGAMFRLGSATDATAAPGLHTPLFDVDERVLMLGAKILARAVIEWCKPQTPVSSFEI